MKDFRTLQVWQKSHQLAIEIFNITRSFPKEEMFGITSQLRRAVVSIPANIAEGCGRGSDKDFSRFISISMGSACESEYFVMLCNDLHFLDDTLAEKYLESLTEIKKMLASLIKTLNKS